MGSKGEHTRKVRTRFRFHWGVTNGTGGNVCCRTFRKQVTTGDLNKECWSGNLKKADKADKYPLTVPRDTP